MTNNLTWEKLTLRLRNPFRIAYGVSETRVSHWIRLRDDEGWGESAIPPYYGVSDEASYATWQTLASKNLPFPDSPAEIERWVGTDGPATARCAVDLALYDRIGKREKLPLWQLLGLPQPKPLASSFTVVIDEPEEMARMALSIPNYKNIKIKLGGDERDMERVAAVRGARPDAKLRVDANAGWSREQAVRYLHDLEALDVEMVEQPLAKDDIEGMGLVQKQTRIPVVADESVLTVKHVEALAAAGVAGINLKLQKAGGLSPVLHMLKRGQELGLRIMLGCMIETSIGATAMAHLMGTAEWVDLDSPILITNDPFDGIHFADDCAITLPDRAGIGVISRT